VWQQFQLTHEQTDRKLPFHSVSGASSKEGEIMLELKSVRMDVPKDANIIVGQSHFIKTVEDLYEAVATTAPHAKFGLAFNESSGACLVRSEGNDSTLRDAAVRNAQLLGAGHVFILILQDAFPINVMSAIRNVPEVCSIFCATANPVEIIVAESEQGRGVLGVIDGSSPKGVEGEAEISWRHDLLRKFGYKR
jgi:adenosine/AMP kinase